MPVSKQVIKVRLQKSSSSVDLNDPVVMENMLEKVHLSCVQTTKLLKREPEWL